MARSRRARDAVPRSAATALAAGSTFDRLIVRHHREGIIEMMQLPFPFLIPRGAAKVNFVGCNRLPSHEKHVLARAFHTTLEFVRNVSRHLNDDGLRPLKRSHEFRRPTSTDP